MNLPSIEPFLKDEAQLARVTSRNGDGSLSFADSISVPCYFQESSRRLRNEAGDSRETRGMIFFGPIEPIPEESKITHGGKTYEVFRSTRVFIPDGDVHHLEVDVR